jgi:excinuclease ABC subunit A
VDILLKNVKTHNLKGFDIAFAPQKLHVVTGLSGSGKSSLVFDTLYAESYRRYLESLSSYARQYLKALPRPKIDDAENLPAAIAIKQSRGTNNPRSNVGTLTELNDLMRSWFKESSEAFCPSCHTPIKQYDPDMLSAHLLKNYPKSSVIVCCRLDGFKSISSTQLKAYLLAQGFNRLLVQGDVSKLEEVKLKDLSSAHLVIDKIATSDSSRMSEAITLAYQLAQKQVMIIIDEKSTVFSQDLICDGCGKGIVPKSEYLFSVNHPYGACSLCQGFGMEQTIDEKKVIPDMHSSIDGEGIAAFHFGEARKLFTHAKKSAKILNLAPSKEFIDYTPKEWEWLWQGDNKGYMGIRGFFAFLESKRHKTHFRIHQARFRKYIICSRCDGSGLNESAHGYKIDGRTFADFNKVPVLALQDYFSKLKVPDGLSALIQDMKNRCQYLCEVGLGYLSLRRSARSLSGGELQRVMMARCLGSELSDTLYCLDEPTAGLHPRDSERLLEVLRHLRDQGNTLVVVEHERTIVNGADCLHEIGPAAGHLGGYLIDSQSAVSKQTLTVPKNPLLKKPRGWIKLKNVRTHNLRGFDLQIPTGVMVGVCGVSGSGKTSLIQHTLYPLLCEHFKQSPDGYLSPYSCDSMTVEDKELKNVLHVGQASIGRSSRSNIASYLGLLSDIRKEFSQTPAAKKLKLTPGHFSFNTSGGRCETCRGLGTIVEELSFLGDMAVTCPDCHGRRFNDKVLSISYNGKTLLDILDLTVDEAKAFFQHSKSMHATIALIESMGLGYMRLGQETSSFSGGEAQRLKLLKLLLTAEKQQRYVLIFDEPTTGLADEDVHRLSLQLKTLVDKGHSLIVIEHHMGLLSQCDHLIEIGPDAADKGGDLVFSGAPHDIIKEKRSISAKFLKPFLSKKD